MGGARARLVVLLTALIGVLAACGFHPLYATGPLGEGVAAELAAVAIPEPQDRLSQLIRNDLLSAFRPVGTAAPDRYTLLIAPGASEDKTIENAANETIRKAVRVNARFELIERGSGRALDKGATFSQVSYDETGQSFADLQARTNALERAAHEVSLDIRTRLAAYFSGRRSAARE